MKPGKKEKRRRGKRGKEEIDFELYLNLNFSKSR